MLVIERVRKYVDTLSPILFDVELKSEINEEIKRKENTISRLNKKINNSETTTESNTIDYVKNKLKYEEKQLG